MSIQYAKALLRRAFATLGLPPSLAVLYFVNACTQSFPLTANMGFLNVELQMPQSTQSLYYAVTFMPWSLKPIYGAIADRLPIRGYRFMPWLAIASMGSAACYLAMALVVTTTAGAFLVALLRAICNAFAELMLGASLVGFARHGGGSAATLQAGAVACRMGGTVLCHCMGLAIYPCGTQGKRLSDRQVIGLTAVFPILVALFSVFHPESRVGVCDEAQPAGRRREVFLFLLVLPLQACVLWSQVCTRSHCVLVAPQTWQTTLYVLLGLAIGIPAVAGLAHLHRSRRSGLKARLLTRGSPGGVPAPPDCVAASRVNGSGHREDAPSQAAALLPGQRGVDSDESVRCACAPSSKAAAVADGVAAHAIVTTGGELEGGERRRAGASTPPFAESTPPPNMASVSPPTSSISAQTAVLVLLLLTCTPSSSLQSASFQYNLFSTSHLLCEIQYLALITSTANMCSSLAFGALFQSSRLRRIVIGGCILASVANLSSLPLPMVCAQAPLTSSLPTPSLPTPPPSAVPPKPQPCDMKAAFAVAAASSGIDGLFSEIGFLPKLVIATEVASRWAEVQRSSSVGGAQIYGAMLMVIDMGDAISLQVTAPIVSALGITYEDFSALPVLIGISTSSSLAVLIGLAAVWAVAEQRARSTDVSQVQITG